MRRVSCTFSVARRDWLVLGPTLNRSESRCWACPSIGLSKVRTHGPLRQRNSGSARLHNISVAVEEDATVFVVYKLSSKLVVQLTIHGDQDRQLEVGPWSLDVVAYVVAVLLRRESGCRPLAGIDTQPRTLDVLVIDDPLAVAGRDVVTARVVEERAFSIFAGFVQFCPVVSNFVHEPSAAALSTPAIYRRVGGNG